MNHVKWAWATSESIHFIGLCLLIGTVGTFDLRMIGLIKKIPVAAMHRLVPWGILGYCLNVLTGITFLQDCRTSTFTIRRSSSKSRSWRLLE